MIELDNKPASLNVLGNILNSFYSDTGLPDFLYVSINSPSDVSIKIDHSQVNQNTPDFFHKIEHGVSKTLIAAIYLLEYLNERKLVYFSGNLSIPSIGTVKANTIYSEFQCFEDEQKALIYKYARKKIHISQALIILAQNKFKSDEELWREKEDSSRKQQLLITQIALAVTFLGLLASIFIPIFSTPQILLTNESITKKIDEPSLLSMSETINNLSLSISQSNAEIVSNLNDLDSSVIAISSSIANQQHDEIISQLSELIAQLSELNPN